MCLILNQESLVFGSCMFRGTQISCNKSSRQTERCVLASGSGLYFVSNFQNSISAIVEFD